MQNARCGFHPIPVMLMTFHKRPQAKIPTDVLLHAPYLRRDAQADNIPTLLKAPQLLQTLLVQLLVINFDAPNALDDSRHVPASLKPTKLCPQMPLIILILIVSWTR